MKDIKFALEYYKGICVILLIGIILLISLFIYYHFIIPNSYKRVDNNLISEDISQYKDNEYNIININNETMMEIYYNYIRNLMLNDKTTLWNLLSNDVKKRFNNEEKSFKIFIEGKITNKTKSNKIKRLAKNHDNIYIEDSEGNKFSIKEDAVWDIEITGIN